MIRSSVNRFLMGPLRGSRAVAERSEQSGRFSARELDQLDLGFAWLEVLFRTPSPRAR